MSSLGEAAELWENVSPETRHWLNIRLVGTKSNRDGIGARIRIGNQYAEMTTTVGYASSANHGVHFGLDNAPTAVRIEIRWPSGTIQVLKDIAADRVFTVVEPKR